MELQQLIKKFDIKTDKEIVIKHLGTGAEARVVLVAKRSQAGILFLFSRKIYDNPNKAKRDFKLFQKLQNLKDRGQLPGFRVAKPIKQEGNILEIEYIEGIPVNSIRPGTNPKHRMIYNKFRESFDNVYSLWIKRVKYLDGEISSLDDVIKRQEEVGEEFSFRDIDTNIYDWVSVERKSRRDYHAGYQLKAANIIVENFTQDFVIVDPI